MGLHRLLRRRYFEFLGGKRGIEGVRFGVLGCPVGS